MTVQTSGSLAADTQSYHRSKSMKRMKMKSSKSSPKALKGKFAQSDTMADMKTMGNPKARKAREKRLSKAMV